MARQSKFVMQKHGERLEFCGDAQKRLYAAWVSGLDDGQIVDAAFGKHRHPKTQKQLGYWYAVLMPFAAEELRGAGHDELFEVGVGALKVGVATTPDTCDLLFKTLYQASNQIERQPQKRNMTDEEMGKLIDFTLAWLAKNLGAVAPLPERD